MLVDTGSKRRMPIRLPRGESLRSRIAEAAAEISGLSADYYLERIGPVEPVLSSEYEGSSWRLAACHGSYEDLEIISRAAQAVQRLYPLIEQ